MASTLVVVGLGNPLLGDDGAGVVAARLVRERLELEHAAGAPPPPDFVEVYAGGLRLMDELEGYDQAVILDAMVTGGVVGELRGFTLSELLLTKHVASTHDTNLATALEFGRTLGLRLPTDVTVLGIEGLHLESFCEELSPAVAAALPRLVERAVDLVHSARKPS